jgi:glycosyltransferase involved in cell wall biosynthesis
MNEQYPNCPEIPPVTEGVKRPLWSVMIPTYNCAELLRQTLESLLIQDPGPDEMQIVVVDNHSTKDNPEAVVKELAGDRVEFYRQPENVGSLNNFQTCLELSIGELVHLLHSDDCLRPSFYEKMAKPFLEDPNLGAAFCRSIFMDENCNWEGFSDLELPQSGILPKGWIEKLADVCRISVPSLAVVRRQVYETIGGYDSRCGLSGDWEFWVRVFANYPMWFEAEPLAKWRRHSMSNNVTNAKSPSFIQENFYTVEAILSYLPNGGQGKVGKKIKQNCAFLALQSAEYFFQNGDTSRGFSLLQQGLKYSPSSQVLMSACRILWENVPLSLLESPRNVLGSQPCGNRKLV